jgi:hypothetical protein
LNQRQRGTKEGRWKEEPRRGDRWIDYVRYPRCHLATRCPFLSESSYLPDLFDALWPQQRLGGDLVGAGPVDYLAEGSSSHLLSKKELLRLLAIVNSSFLWLSHLFGIVVSAFSFGGERARPQQPSQRLCTAVLRR